MMKNGPALGIDLGGTKTYAIVTNARHQVQATAKINTDPAAGPEKMAADIVELGRQVLETAGLTYAQVQNIGIAIPSPVDPETGDCYHATNLGWKNASMKDYFRGLLGKEVYLGNDANLGLLGEYFCGAARGFQNVVAYYVGTGLGGGLIVNGRLVCGNNGLAGEFGHMIVKQGGRRCGCGHRGCAEAYCSKIAFVKALKKAVFKRGMKTELPPDKFNRDSRNIKSKYLAKAYQSGDPAVSEVVNRGAYMLGVAAAGVSAAVAPECIILGGGVIDALGQEMYGMFKKSFEDHLFGIDPEKIQIRFAELGDNSVAMGASILARLEGRV